MNKNGFFMNGMQLINVFQSNCPKKRRCATFFSILILLGSLLITLPVLAQDSDADPLNDEEQKAMIALDKDLFCDVRLGEELKVVEDRFNILKKEDDFSTGAKIVYLEPLSKEYKEIKITFVADKCDSIEAVFTNFNRAFADREYQILEIKFGSPTEEGTQDGFRYYKFSGQKYKKDIDVLFENDEAETNPTMKISFRFRKISLSN